MTIILYPPNRSNQEGDFKASNPKVYTRVKNVIVRLPVIMFEYEKSRGKTEYITSTLQFLMVTDDEHENNDIIWTRERVS